MALGFVTDRLSKRQRVVKAAEPSDDLYEMANLFPDDTGLPVTVWVSPRGRARHAARIKVCRTPGNKMVPTNTAVVSISAEPTVVAGTLPTRYFEPVARWVASNREALLEYWAGAIGTGALLRKLKRVGRAR